MIGDLQIWVPRSHCLMAGDLGTRLDPSLWQSRTCNQSHTRSQSWRSPTAETYIRYCQLPLQKTHSALRFRLLPRTRNSEASGRRELTEVVGKKETSEATFVDFYSGLLLCSLWEARQFLSSLFLVAKNYAVRAEKWKGKLQQQWRLTNSYTCSFPSDLKTSTHLDIKVL